MRRTRHHDETRPERRASTGFTTVELLISLAIIGVLSAIAIPELQDARIRSEMRAVTSDLRSVHTAFKMYYRDHGEYPDSGAAFNLVNFNPLFNEGYYSGLITARMINGRADDYGAPDDLGTNQEFWLELTLKRSTRIRFLVADSDDAPLGGGERYDGVYVFDDGVRVNL
jgi:prepilin-type N-terminal cleavage/methylation domain-containing protein